MNNIIISGGGTGGHIYPAIAVAEKLREKNKAVQIIVVGNKNNIEKKIALEDSNFEFVTIPSQSISGKNFLYKISSLFILLYGFLKALWFLLIQSPKCVIASGGYASIPVLLASVLLRKQIFLLEQNSIVGKVNRLFSRFAKEVYLGLPLYNDDSYKSNFILTGNPLRKIMGRFNNSENKKRTITIGVMGGSQGAEFLNDMVPKALVLIKKIKFNVLHLSGHKKSHELIEIYKCNNIEAEICEYQHNMDKFYSSLDLIISRSGAMAVSEISYYRIPSILIPYPYASDNHQKYNAIIAEKQKRGAIYLDQDEITKYRLADEIEKILRKKSLYKFDGIAKKDSADIIVSRILKHVAI